MKIAVVIGRDAKAETKTGAGLTTTSRAIVIGSNSRVAADVTQGVAIGSGLSPDEGAVVTGDQSIAIGGNVKVDAILRLPLVAMMPEKLQIS